MFFFKARMTFGCIILFTSCNPSSGFKYTSIYLKYAGHVNGNEIHLLAGASNIRYSPIKVSVLIFWPLQIICHWIDFIKSFSPKVYIFKIWKKKYKCHFRNVAKNSVPWNHYIAHWQVFLYTSVLSFSLVQLSHTCKWVDVKFRLKKFQVKLWWHTQSFLTV